MSSIDSLLMLTEHELSISCSFDFNFKKQSAHLSSQSTGIEPFFELLIIKLNFSKGFDRNEKLRIELIKNTKQKINLMPDMFVENNYLNNCARISK